MLRWIKFGNSIVSMEHIEGITVKGTKSGGAVLVLETRELRFEKDGKTEDIMIMFRGIKDVLSGTLSPEAQLLDIDTIYTYKLQMDRTKDGRSTSQK